jgi:hypothetical protein
LNRWKAFYNLDELHKKIGHINAELVVTSMSKKPHETPLLDELEHGPWPSFV